MVAAKEAMAASMREKEASLDTDEADKGRRGPTEKRKVGAKDEIRGKTTGRLGPA